MSKFTVENRTSGHIFGIYEAQDEEEAIAAMLADAGHVGPADDAIIAYPSDSCHRCGVAGIAENRFGWDIGVNLITDSSSGLMFCAPCDAELTADEQDPDFDPSFRV